MTHYTIHQALQKTDCNPFDRRLQPVYILQEWAITTGFGATQNHSMSPTRYNTTSRVCVDLWMFDRKEEAVAFKTAWEGEKGEEAPILPYTRYKSMSIPATWNILYGSMVAI